MAFLKVSRLTFYQQYPAERLEVKVIAEDPGMYRLADYLYKEDVERLVAFLQNELTRYAEGKQYENPPSSLMDYLESQIEDA